MLNRVKAGIGVATIGMAMALIPAISPASASVSSVSSVSGVSSLSSNALCSDYKNQQSALANTQGSALAKAYSSGNWPVIQKALLSTYSAEGGALNKLQSVVSGAPSNVKAAVGTFVKFENSLKSVIQQSTSLTNFASRAASVATNPKLASAGRVLAAYSAKLCPGLVPKTTTPTT